MSERRRGPLVFRVKGDRLRLPQTVNEVTVSFGPAPVQEIRLRKFGLKRQLVLRGTIVEPAALKGNTLTRFYNLPQDGAIPIGSDLMADIQALLGHRVTEGEDVDVVEIFRGKTARVRLRRVEKDRRGQDLPLEQQYVVMDHIMRGIS